MNAVFETDRAPNVIWVLTDQLRAQALACRGDVNVDTPNIDNLAREGVSFCNAISGAPWCCPFRGSLLTGMYPHQHGVTQTPSALDPALPTISDAFKAQGYHTAWVGKWHLDGSSDVTHYIPPTRRGGFDYFMGFENNNNQNESYVHGTDSEDFIRLPGYETDSLTDLFLSHLQGLVAQQSDYKPFFAVLSVQPPHSPYVAPTDPTGGARYYHHPQSIVLRPNVPPGAWQADAREKLSGYYGMIENIDANVGRIRMALKEWGIDRETYIVFLSDHGDCLCSHGQWEKSSPWEESIRIPFIVGRVGGIDHMKVAKTNVMLNHIDIAPTTLGLCGIAVPQEMQGYDYSYLCKKESDGKPCGAPPPTSVYLQQIPAKHHPHSINKPWRAVVTQDGWKYVCFPGVDAMLFNLNDDPYELANLCYDMIYQEKKEALHALLQAHIISTGDCFVLPDIS